MAYATESNRLILMMLNESIPRNQSQCRDCQLFKAVNNYHGSCRHRSIVLAKDPSCYQAKLRPTPAQLPKVAEPTGDYANGNAPNADQLTQFEAALDHLEEPNSFEEPDYTLGTPTDETLDEIAATMDQDELADLADAITEFLKLSDRANRATAPDDQAVIKAKQDKTLLTIQQLMVNLAADIGLIQFTPELYQRLYGQRSI